MTFLPALTPKVSMYLRRRSKKKKKKKKKKKCLHHQLVTFATLSYFAVVQTSQLFQSKSSAPRTHIYLYLFNLCIYPTIYLSIYLYASIYILHVFLVPFFKKIIRVRFSFILARLNARLYTRLFRTSWQRRAQGAQGRPPFKVIKVPLKTIVRNGQKYIVG